MNKVILPAATTGAISHQILNNTKNQDLKVYTYEVDGPISKVEHQNQKCSKKLHFQKCRPPTFAPL